MTIFSNFLKDFTFSHRPIRTILFDIEMSIWKLAKLMRYCLSSYNISKIYKGILDYYVLMNIRIYGMYMCACARARVCVCVCVRGQGGEVHTDVRVPRRGDDREGLRGREKRVTGGRFVPSLSPTYCLFSPSLVVKRISLCPTHCSPILHTLSSSRCALFFF